jgi:O-acetyl-ADP-ribose deacetylase (regulator of RNase III)
MEPGGRASEESVRSALRRSLEIAEELACHSLAVPALGAGVAGLPLQRCAEILLEETHRHLAGETALEEVRFVLFGEPAYRVFESVQDAIRITEQAKRWSS